MPSHEHTYRYFFFFVVAAVETGPRGMVRIIGF